MVSGPEGGIFIIMVQVNELRIGNRFIDNGREFTLDLKMMHAYTGDQLTYNIDNLKGIPLTPEILDKLGFGIEEPAITYAWKFAPPGNTGTVECKYLHQIQNLYFALTGRELKVEL